MTRVFLILSTIFLIGIGNLPLQAADRIPAEHFFPKHILATTHPYNQCPQGYSRVFGRNPPTCYENCPQGWTVHTTVTTGAVCVRCPPGWIYSYGGDVSGYWCERSTGGLWGQ